MAENNLARNRNDVPEFFADGDPLAELARIVGYEERVVAKPEPLAPPTTRMERREPAFNLEDELLREFEQYDVPRLDPVDDVGVTAEAHRQPVLDAAPQVLAQRDPRALEREAPVFKAEPSLQDLGLVDSAVAASEPVVSAPAGRADDGFDAFLAFDGDASVTDQEPALSRHLPVAPEMPAGDPAADSFDLASELETSIAAAPAVAPVKDVRRKQPFTPSFRMPIANFQSMAGVAPVQRREEPPVEAPVAVAPAEPQAFTSWAAPVVDTPVLDMPVMDAPVGQAAIEQISEPQVVAAEPIALEAVTVPVAGPVEPIPSVHPVAAPAELKTVEPQAPAAAEEPFSELDELFYDVDRYSSAERPSVFLDAAVADMAPAVPAAAAAEAAGATDAELQDPFADVEFELALDDLELDLAEMVVAENSKPAAPVSAAHMATPAAPRLPAQPAAAAQPSAAAVEPVSMAAVSHAAVPAAAASASADEAQAELDDDVAFDPSLIADADEHLETIPELDVPALPVEQPDETPVYRSEYDVDIDAELASLLESTEAVAAREPEAVQAQPEAKVSEPAAGPAKSIYADLDDFERALEEDFRRSLATPLEPDDAYAGVDGYHPAMSETGSGAARRWIAPLAVIGALALGGTGAYLWLGSSVPGVGGSGEPIVIAADNEPVKIAPENPGGKTVPNQDKAVYDRVAGSGSAAPKQQQLISSSEEPVDVVQKTLMPETVPLEGENDSEMAELSEADEPRLLPGEQAEQPQAADQQPVAVMPRKVKTMIVRADGKLVEQESPAAAPVVTEKVAAASAKSDSPMASHQSAVAFPTAAPASTGSTPAAPAIVPVSAPMSGPAAEDMLATAPDAPATISTAVAETMPAAPSVTPAQASSVKAPVPTARPAQQPVNVVAAVSDQGRLRPSVPAAQAAQTAAPAATAAAATQVASLGEGGYVIQIASLPSQADAQKSYQNLSTKFGSVIGGKGVDIKAADVAGKGTFYRVRIPAGSKEQAVALCEKYRAAGGSCLVAR